MKNSETPSLFPQRHYGRDYQSSFAEPLKYFPLAIFTFGVKYRSQADNPEKTPHRVLGIKEDCVHRAKSRAVELLNPNVGEYVVLVKREPNPDHVEYTKKRLNSVLPAKETN